MSDPIKPNDPRICIGPNAPKKGYLIMHRDDIIYDVEYLSTKTYNHSVGLSCVFRQHKARSHCRFLHGYALKVKLTFVGQLDDNGWVMDFGSLRPIKQWLEDTFDHKLLVAKDDPMLPLIQDLRKSSHYYPDERLQIAREQLAQVVEVEATGCEAFAKLIYNYVGVWLETDGAGKNRVALESVEVSEHEGNSAIVRGKVITHWDTHL